VVKNAGHYSFMSPFADDMKNEKREITMDPKGFNRAAFHTKMNREIDEFFTRSF
jgi:hypothetical protein